MTTRPYAEVYYPGAGSRLRLFARDYPAKGDNIPPVALLMMHGLTRNSADFEPLIDALDPAHRVIVPDQRGRGRSDHDSDPARYRPDTYVGDMWALLDRLGVERVICLGTSMGGLMAMMMAGEQPHRVSGLVLNDVGPEVAASGLARLRSYVGAGEPMSGWDAAARECARINSDVLQGLDAQDWQAFARRTCEELVDGTVRFAYDPAIAGGLAEEDTSAAPADMWPLWDQLEQIPALVLRGAKSDILEPATLTEMKRRHPGTMSSAEIPRRGHAPLLDEGEAVSAIRAFLASLSA
ncbi:MAG: alpha/beta fold hydrolase [Erythrobacter sp.]